MAKIYRTCVTNDYHETKQKGYDLQETNDCAVVAVSVATGKPYEEVHAAMASAGRKHRSGTWDPVTWATIGALGFKARRMDMHQELWHKLPVAHQTLKHLTSHHPRRFPGVFDSNKVYLCFSRGHVWCVKHGQNHDWSINRVLRIMYMWEVTKA